MLFATDKQTLEDLNIFGRHGGDSVYQLFNRCTTRGGAAILEEMFHYPLSDADAINRRTGIIRYFMTAAASFPFQGALFDAIEPYLANTDERTRLTTEDHSISKKIGNLIAMDADTTLIYKGVAALAEMLNGLRDYLGMLPEKDSEYYQPERQTILQMLSAADFSTVLNRETKGRLSHNVIAAYDVLFRFRHREAVQKILRQVFYLDVYLSVAKVARDRGFVFPKALPGEPLSLSLEGVYHPQVKNAVANSIRVSPDGNVIFLTGANMAGKSTFMKSLSLSLFLAHIGFPVAAVQMEFSVLDGIYPPINLPE
ncbi:MAG: DNA mismatch repair protein, partial [Bacteroidetes bacterium]|nr:DNA mismatch repair protein [Bacteroidota bacterium]